MTSLNPIASPKSNQHRGHRGASLFIILGGFLFLGLILLHLRSESWRVTLNDAVVGVLCFVALAVCQLLIGSMGEVDADRRFRWDSKIGSLGGARAGYIFSSPLVLLAFLLIVVLATCVVAVDEQGLPQPTKGSRTMNAPTPPSSDPIDQKSFDGQ
jgi:hypothetical protein